MGEALHLPPGYGFCPTGGVLLVHYLKKKIKGERYYPEPVAEADIYNYAPWDLPGEFKSGSGDQRWYFLCPVKKKYSSGPRINRETKYGSWKKTGNDSPVYHDKELVGSKKTLVFYEKPATGLRGGKAPRGYKRGKAPRGYKRGKADWIMHEYSLGDEYMAKEGIVENTYVLCRILRGPRNGAQYGAPFKEEERNYDEEDDSAEAVTSAGSLPNSSSSLAAVNTNVLGVTTSESGLSEAMRSQREGVSAVLNNDASNELSRVLCNNDILPEVLTSFQEDNPLILSENNRNRDPNHDENALSLTDIMGESGDIYFCEETNYPLDDNYFDMADLERPLEAPPT